VGGCLSGAISEYENLLRVLEICQDRGMIEPHDQLITVNIPYYEGREDFGMVSVLKIEQSATYSYRGNWIQARKQLVSVIYSDIKDQCSKVIKARALYLLVAAMRRNEEYRKSRTDLSYMFYLLEDSKRLLYGFNSPEDWAELYQTYGCVWMDYMSQLPLDQRNVAREKAIDCFGKAIDFSEQDPRERVQMKRQSYCHLKLAKIHLGCCSTSALAKESHLPLNDYHIKQAESHLDFVQFKFGDTLPTATRMLLWKTQSDLFFHKGQYDLAINKAKEALKLAVAHGFNTELNTLQEKIDCYQKNLRAHDPEIYSGEFVVIRARLFRNLVNANLGILS